MILPLVFRSVLPLTALAALSACGANTMAAVERPDYSPGYSYVAMDGAGGSGKGVSGGVLAPDSCLNEGIDDDAVPAATSGTVVRRVGVHLAPGCANAYNLQRMVETERDLVEGREMGPAHAAPSVRAAQRYLYGDVTETGGATNISTQ